MGYNAQQTSAGSPPVFFRERCQMTIQNRASCVSLCVLLAAAGLWAQGVEATLKGRVTDSSGAAVPGAKIEVKNTGTNLITPTVTDSVGQYTVPFLQPGMYTLTLEAAGFKK